MKHLRLPPCHPTAPCSVIAFSRPRGITCCALRLLSSCSSLVLSFISRLSLFSHVDCSWARALWSLSTFSTYALFLLSSSSNWRPRARAASSASSSCFALRFCSSTVARKHCSSLSTRSRSKFCSSSEAEDKQGHSR